MINSIESDRRQNLVYVHRAAFDPVAAASSRENVVAKNDDLSLACNAQHCFAATQFDLFIGIDNEPTPANGNLDAIARQTISHCANNDWLSNIIVFEDQQYLGTFDYAGKLDFADRELRLDGSGRISLKIDKQPSFAIDSYNPTSPSAGRGPPTVGVRLECDLVRAGS